MVKRVRRQVLERLPEPTLRYLVRARHGETPVLRRLRAAPERLARRRAAAPDGYSPVPFAPAFPFASFTGWPNAGQHPVRARLVTQFDAHQERQATVDAVLDALVGHGVRCVALPGGRGASTRIAVPDAYRPAAVAALAGTLTASEWAVVPLPPPTTGYQPGGHRPHPLTDGSGFPADGGRVFRLLAAGNGELLAGEELGCDIEFNGGAFTGGPEPARATTGEAVARPHRLPSIFDVTEPVDIVYTWVDGDDPAWREKKASYSGDRNLRDLNRSAAHHSRFTSRDELRYSLRSVAMYVNWVRRIFIVTDGQVPPWLDTTHPKITVVDHKEIFTDPSVLPVFNSHAIESQLHHIDDLAEQYLYLNDDFFFGRAVQPDLFFHSNGIAKFFLSPHTLDSDPPSSRDLPVMAAGKRNRSLIEERFGVTIGQKLKHTPHSQLRSVIEEIELRHPDVFSRVAQSRFRHHDDVSIPSALAHYYAYALGRAVPGRIDYRYQDIALPDTRRRLEGLVRARNTDVFCLNDNESPSGQIDEQRAMLSEFFERYYPLPSPFERPEPSDVG